VADLLAWVCHADEEQDLFAREVSDSLLRPRPGTAVPADIATPPPTAYPHALARSASKEKEADMAKVIGIGGVFFRSDDPERLYAWYEEHLGLHRDPGGVVLFPWRQAGEDRVTVWSIFPRSTDYFGPANPSFMVNYIVDDLDGMVGQLRAGGPQVEDKREESEYGSSPGSRTRTATGANSGSPRPDRREGVDRDHPRATRWTSTRGYLPSRSAFQPPSLLLRPLGPSGNGRRRPVPANRFPCCVMKP
jgi:hypothetical protein